MKYQMGIFGFNAISSFFAMWIFVIVSEEIVWSREYLLYSLLYAFFCSVTGVTNFLAITQGSLAITTLVIAYSLVIPTLYGILILKEEIGMLQYMGVVLLLISLYLVRGKDEAVQKNKMTFRWIIYVSIAFVGNGMCAVVQQWQQGVFGGRYDSSFMVVALAVSTIIMFVIACFTEKRSLVMIFKNGSIYAGLFGICNGMVNFLLLMIITVSASSVAFPVLSAGQLVGVFLISCLLYKEKFIPRQIVGFACGIMTLILLNI